MGRLDQAIATLKTETKRFEKELSQVAAAIAALEGASNNGRGITGRLSGRTMSASKIATAQKARWRSGGLHDERERRDDCSIDHPIEASVLNSTSTTWRGQRSSTSKRWVLKFPMSRSGTMLSSIVVQDLFALSGRGLSHTPRKIRRFSSLRCLISGQR